MPQKHREHPECLYFIKLRLRSPTLPRVFAEEGYGLAPEQVVGADIDYAYEVRSGTPVIVRRAALSNANPRVAKPVALYPSTSHLTGRKISVTERRAGFTGAI